MNKLARIAISAICLAVLTTALFAAEDNDEIDRSPVFHIFADVNLIPTTQLEYDRPRVVIKAIVPKLVSQTEDEIIDQYNEVVLSLIDEEAENFRQIVKNHAEYQEAMAKSDVKNDLIIDFDSSVLTTSNSPILSLRFVIHGVVSGMSGSYRKHRVLNYDLDTGSEVQLAELFLPTANYLDAISTGARNILARKLKDQSRVIEGTTPTFEHFQNWNLTAHGLRITFDQQQVAPAKYGSQTITIPYADLEEIINPESVLATCIKHRRRCFGNNVLTGGFIDEARNKHTRIKPYQSA